MPLNWTDLRKLNGSQADSFEELCCQLARLHDVPDGSQFFRKGLGGDAGVECYWRLPDGEEWGWQAKFFLRSPDQSGKQQLQNSLRTAFERHPRLTRYFACLPCDRSDARKGDAQSFARWWESWTEKWAQNAAGSERDLEIIYWGQSEICDLLSSEQNRGRVWFFFNGPHLSAEWFQRRLRDSLDAARGRYEPELHLDLSVNAYFEAAGRLRSFAQELEDHCATLTREMSELLQACCGQVEPTGPLATIRQFAENVIRCSSDASSCLSSHPEQGIDWAELTSRINELRDPMLAVESEVRGLEDSPGKSRALEAHSRFEDATRELFYFCDDDRARLTNRPLLLLTGGAGQGKTHQLCHISETHMGSGWLRLLLHGEHFRDGEPWSQIIELLGLQCSAEEFLGAMESAALASNSRLLILIDALNEGDGKHLWRKHLPALANRVLDSPWLGLCLSIRSDYEEHLLPHQTVADFVRIEHRGFRGISVSAYLKYFSHFGLSPAYPPVQAEFQNPLFLKLLCTALSATGHKAPAASTHGFSAMMKSYLAAIDRRLASPTRLDYDSRDHVVQKAVIIIADQMIDLDRAAIPRSLATSTLNELLPRSGHSHSLYRHLISEGILFEVPIRHRDGIIGELVRFTYQRVSDHLIAAALLDRYSNTDADEIFERGAPIWKSLLDEEAYPKWQGVILELAIQVPERLGYELHRLAPFLDQRFSCRNFISSLPWRHPTAFGDDSRALCAQLEQNDELQDLYRETMLSLATVAGHPLNADHLHTLLVDKTLPDRDSVWSTFIFRQWESPASAVRILVEWAAQVPDKVEKEVARLASTALAWFLTSSHRYLRDRATKALVALLERKPDLLEALVQRFGLINDLYVRERVFAVAYGCVLRRADQNWDSLASTTYNLVFVDQPPPHILLRDYARGIIEQALLRNPRLPIDPTRIRPPYESTWFNADELPPKIELADWARPSNDKPGRFDLYHSLVGLGDFARKIAGGLEDWRPTDDQPGTKVVDHWSGPRLVFDGEFGRRWMLHRVQQLGWSDERFGYFDRNLPGRRHLHREEHKPERIGKKYQWLAYHELLARLSDSCAPGEKDTYDGPWQLRRRDIDPSVLVEGTCNDDSHESWWSCPNTLLASGEDQGWLESAEDLPNTKNLLFVSDEKGTEWVILNASYTWTLPKSGRPEVGREVFLNTRSFLVADQDSVALLHWSKRSPKIDDKLPGSESVDIFLGEYQGSAALSHENRTFSETRGWARSYGETPVSVCATTETYMRDGEGYDCSLDGSIDIELPTTELIRCLGLTWSGREGEWTDAAGDVIAIDPSVHNPGPSALLVRRDRLWQLLDERKWSLFWRIYGQKRLTPFDRAKRTVFHIRGRHLFRQGNLEPWWHRSNEPIDFNPEGQD